MYEQKLIESNPNILIILQIWWALAWRGLLWLLVTFFVIFIMCLIFGFLARLVGIDASVTRAVGLVLGIIMGLAGGVWGYCRAFRGIIGKSFMEYKLLIVSSSGGHSIIESNPPEGFIFKVWLAMFWRQMLWFIVSLIPLFIVGFSVAFASLVLGTDQETSKAIAKIIVRSIGFLVGIWIFRIAFVAVLGKDFSGQQLLLVTPYGANQLRAN